MTGTDTIWVCTRCGTEGGHPIDALGSLDQRYIRGYCDTCTKPHPKTPRKSPRATSTLVQKRFFDESKFDERRERDELASIIALFRRGQAIVPMTDHQAARLVELGDKYGTPGFLIPDGLRTKRG